ncbi:MFS transporter [Uliginosibacterium sp. H1]|uniref:MFS transporter n=1 Tax=Uliginosibacterium sp. H1 TaxID=3114757 RepID=UPI002E1990BE|nr:MFS transporter [Uliginosibacterium sp. H1]
MNAAPRTLRHSLLAMIGICLVIMLIAVDSTVVGTALPRIVAELQGFELYPWIASAYLMTNAVLIPISGRLGDLYGRKPFVMASVIIFTLASVLCGMADSMLQLVLARGLQGVGGGMLTGVAFACISDLFPDRLQRVRWQAMLSATFGISTAIGPALGGWMTEHLGWRSVFYVNVPIAALAIPVVWRYLPQIVHHEGEDRSIDWVGAILLAVGVCTLLLATEEGPTIGFTSPLFLGLALAAIVVGVLFVRHQMGSRFPIIPARLFSNRAVRQLSLLGMMTGLMMFVLVFYAPLLLQGGFGLSPKAAGLVVTPLLVFITVGSIANGRLLPRLQKPERLIGWGLLLLMVGCLLLNLIRADSPQALSMLAFAMCGLALGFQLPNLTLHIQTVVEARDLGISSALIQTTRMLGSMLGASLAGVLVHLTYSNRITAALAQAGVSHAEVARLLATPQILIRGEDQAALQTLGQQLGFVPQALLDQARDGLIAGVHYAFLACALIALASFLLSRSLPPFVLHRPAGKPA